MLKIMRIETGHDAPVLKLEGVVVGEWVHELRMSCEEALAGSRGLILDLARVSFIGREGIDLFRALKGRHVVLSNCSRFVEEQLKGQPA